MENKLLDISKNLEIKYDMLNINYLPLPIKKMLMQTDKGYRYQVLLFLISFFHNSLGYSLEKVNEIMTVWNSNCNQPLDTKELNKIVNENYNRYYKYSNKLYSKFGYINFNDFNLKEYVIFPNIVIECFPIFNDCAIKIYIAMIYNYMKTNKTIFKKKELIDLCNISEKTHERRMVDLVESQIIVKEKIKREVNYILSIIDIKSCTKGFTKLKISHIEDMLKNDKIADADIKVYILLNYIMQHKVLELNTNEFQVVLGEMTRKSESTISIITSRLKELGYIEKQLYYEEVIIDSKRKQRKRCLYTII